ncbi:MAG: HAD-IA family hydrolase [Gammaproteobacteria bacterium]|nr:HAD-IA family hydrolase [Gammaproteobacteria bacterium]
MANKPNYSLVIFDWDGTLVDSIARIIDGLEKTINHLQLEPKTPKKLKEIIGLGLNHAILSLYPELNDQQVEHFANSYRQFFTVSQASELFFGVDKMLYELKQKGVMLAIATGKGRSGLNSSMTEVGLEHFFHASRCADETQSKPNPAMLHEILDEFGMDKADAVMIGDSSYDIQMAQQINMDNIGVTYGVHSKEDLTQLNTQLIVEDIESLHHYLIQHTTSF